MSTLLFHGPGARQAAVDKAAEIGRLLGAPFGEDGLKVKVAREIVDLLECAPVGDDIGVIIIGPMDETSPEAADALLKTLEEFDARFFRPLLWAHDAGSVIGTIRSRCLEQWCLGDQSATPESVFLSEAEALCKAALQRRMAPLIETLKDNEGSEKMLLRAAAEVLLAKDEWPWSARIVLWESLREALNIRKPSPRQTLAAFLV